MWKELTEEDKTKYIELSVADKARYEKQKKEYEETGKFSPMEDAGKATDHSDGEKA